MIFYFHTWTYSDNRIEESALVHSIILNVQEVDKITILLKQASNGVRIFCENDKMFTFIFQNSFVSLLQSLEKCVEPLSYETSRKRSGIQ